MVQSDIGESQNSNDTVTGSPFPGFQIPAARGATDIAMPSGGQREFDPLPLVNARSHKAHPGDMCKEEALEMRESLNRGSPSRR